jgi:hypothetical protein
VTRDTMFDSGKITEHMIYAGLKQLGSDINRISNPRATIRAIYTTMRNARWL